MAWRNRKPDLVGKLGHGHAAVGLQQEQDFAVDGVEGMHWDESREMEKEVVGYPNLGRYGAKI